MFVGKSGRNLAVAIILGCSSANSAVAQSAEANSDDWLVGLSLGVPMYSGELAPDFFTAAIHATSAEVGHLGLDASVGTAPRTLIEGMIGLGLRSGLTLPIALSDRVLIFPSAGVGVIAGLGSGGGASAAASLSMSAAGLTEGTSGVRVGVSWHRFSGLVDAVWLVEFGVVSVR